jgi:hypothetical protein
MSDWVIGQRSNWRCELLSDRCDMVWVQAKPAVKMPRGGPAQSLPLRQRRKMGCRYDDAGRLCCHRCGEPGGTIRKRRCPYKVLGDSLNGPRYWLPYCPSLILCEFCCTAVGGERGLHRRCRAAAAASQAAADEVERQLDAGESLSVEAFGDWEPMVPRGMVGLEFVSRRGESYRLMPEADYPNQRVPLSAVRTEPWTDHP